MNLEILVGLLTILTLVLALIQGYDWFKKRNSKASMDVVTSAMQLLKPYQDEVDILRGNLQNANTQITDLTKKLNAAEARAEELNKQLVDAQSEVSYLRVQVNVLTKRLSKEDHG